MVTLEYEQMLQDEIDFETHLVHVHNLQCTLFNIADKLQEKNNSIAIHVIKKTFLMTLYC